MQRRRRPRAQPRNIFAPTERRIVNRARTRPTISENAQTTFQRSNRKKTVKPKKHFLTLETPYSPEIDATQNTELIEDYREMQDRLESFSEYTYATHWTSFNPSRSVTPTWKSKSVPACTDWGAVPLRIGGA